MVDAFQKLWEKCPDLRMGQLFSMIEQETGKKHISYNLEDDKWLEAIERLIIRMDKEYVHK